ncbi:MAG: DUF4258 domain-containing protein [Dehalococcoidia bacterium]
MIKGLLDGIQAEVRSETHRFTLHAGERMIERHISVSEVKEAILSGGSEVVEVYPDDPRGPSCLVLGVTAADRPLHIGCSYPPIVAVITAYDPDPGEWVNWRTRKVKGNG